MTLTLFGANGRGLGGPGVLRAASIILIIAASVLVHVLSVDGIDNNQQSQTDSIERSRRVDSLFSWFNHSTPGCAVSIMEAGEPLYSHAYGMANLELAFPLRLMLSSRSIR